MGYCLIAYDISSNSLRQHISKKLEHKGMRLQKSVFIVKLTSSEMQTLESWIREKLEDGDSLLILPCCASRLTKAKLVECAEPFSNLVYA